MRILRVSLVLAFMSMTVFANAENDEVRTAAEQTLKALRIEGTYVGIRPLEDWYAVNFKAGGISELPISVYVSKDGETAVYGEIFHKGKSLAMLDKMTKPAPDTSRLVKDNRPSFGNGEEVIVFLSPSDWRYEDYLRKITADQNKFHFVLKLYVDDPKDTARGIEQYKRLLSLAGQSLQEESVAHMLREDSHDATEIGVIQSPTIIVKGMIIKLRF